MTGRRLRSSVSGDRFLARCGVGAGRLKKFLAAGRWGCNVPGGFRGLPPLRSVRQDCSVVGVPLPITRIRQVLHEQGRSVTWLASQLHVARSTVYAWDDGASCPPGTRRRIEELLGVSWQDLCHDAEQVDG